MDELFRSVLAKTGADFAVSCSSMRSFQCQIVTCDGVATISVMLPAAARQLTAFVIHPNHLNHTLKPLKTLGYKMTEIEQYLLMGH